MIALATFRVAAYVRSHRVHQALLLMLALLAIVYGSPAPLGEEVAVAADGAALTVPVLAWASRSLLDTEPDGQRAMSAVLVGGRVREIAAGLMAAFAACLVLAGLAACWALLLGASALPAGAALPSVLLLYVLGALTGTVLGALTSRASVASPALSIMALVLAVIVMLLVSASRVYWLTVPLLAWSRAAHDGLLLDRLPWLVLPALLWCAIGILLYARRRLRRAQ
ncbi:hypothetical protein [Nonomuraea pusilla]|uniref:ABC-2 type transport system permease protein n=1 Tax=Nonomuraea pusilla TaxID=46177 RepID=A0A1H7W2U0_9ACTN|nr:hypothetical protein [Nonomuraea pusilla]SEM15385.1 hypothetical protein SAMN05660976_04316 [Nonomuraea pusilla]